MADVEGIWMNSNFELLLIHMISVLLARVVHLSVRNRQYQHELWLRREVMAQAAFLAKKDRQEKERIRREEEEVQFSQPFYRLKLWLFTNFKMFEKVWNIFWLISIHLKGMCDGIWFYWLCAPYSTQEVYFVCCDFICKSKFCIVVAIQAAQRRCLRCILYVVLF